jgi:hypothetical protein
MKLEQIFQDSNSRTIWKNYFKKVTQVLRILDKEARSEVELEIQDHLYESFLDIPGENEVARLLAAIEKLGEPEEYLKAIVSDKLLHSGTRSFAPRVLFLGLFYRLSGSAKHALSSIFFGFAYILIFIFGILSFAKLLAPEHVGLFRWPEGAWAFGFIRDVAGSTEVLGYWIIPIGLLVAVLLYLMLTLILKLTIKKQ